MFFVCSNWLLVHLVFASKSSEKIVWNRNMSMTTLRHFFYYNTTIPSWITIITKNLFYEESPPHQKNIHLYHSVYRWYYVSMFLFCFFTVYSVKKQISHTALTQSLPWQTLNLLILQQPTHQRFPRLCLAVIIESVHRVLRGFISALLGRSVVWNESSGNEQHDDVFYTQGNKLYSKKWTAYRSVGDWPH